MEKVILQLQHFANNTQTTLLNAPGNDLAPEMKTFYEKTLIDNAEPNLVHDQFGDQYNIPPGSGKIIEFRRFSPLGKALTPIQEGVTPPGNRLNVTALTAETKQYGDFIEQSDILELTALDNTILQATEMLGSQAGRTLDTITREIITGGTVMRFAPFVSGSTVDETTNRSEVTGECRLTPDMVLKAATDLKAMIAQKFGSNYVAIIHPYVAYDLMSSEEWIDVHKYAKPDNIYMGEIGQLGGVRFVETTEAKIIGPGRIGGILFERTALAAAASTTEITVTDPIAADSAAAINAAMAGGQVYKIYVDGQLRTIASVTAGNAGAAKITLTDSVTAASGAMVCGPNAGADGSAIFCTMFLGQKAYGTTALEGGGLVHIVKQKGSGGTTDPLDQRSTVGWKATKTAERLVEEYMVRVESGSAYSLTALSN